MTTQLTPWQVALIRLYVGACSECGGRGESHGPDIDYQLCRHCDGQGATLSDATRKNWPWWHVEKHPLEYRPRPYIPDLTNAVAVFVAERLSERHRFQFGTMNDEKWWFVEREDPCWSYAYDSDLPAAVRAALEKWGESDGS